MCRRSFCISMSLTWYSTRQMLRISYFWPGWNSYVRLGVFHANLSTKRSHSYLLPKICLKFLVIRFFTFVAYCMVPRYFLSYTFPPHFDLTINTQYHAYVVPGTRFPSGTCLGEWCKKWLKNSAQHLTQDLDFNKILRSRHILVPKI